MIRIRLITFWYIIKVGGVSIVKVYTILMFIKLYDNTYDTYDNNTQLVVLTVGLILSLKNINSNRITVVV